MGDNTRVWLLLEALRNVEGFGSRGFTAAYEPPSGVVIERAGHFRGIWAIDADQFTWVAAGYNEANFATASLRGALDYTLAEICGRY